jgi:hypothetical protein
MKFIGYLVGMVWFGLAFGAYRTSSAGWAEGHSDIGFWWGVIAALLAIAALSSLVGTTIHLRARPNTH